MDNFLFLVAQTTSNSHNQPKWHPIAAVNTTKTATANSNLYLYKPNLRMRGVLMNSVMSSVGEQCDEQCDVQCDEQC